MVYVAGQVVVAEGGFFFQAEDGIRDDLVTGVQTCALPISPRSSIGDALESTASVHARGQWRRTRRLILKDLRWAYPLHWRGQAPVLPPGDQGGTMNANWMPGVAALMVLALAVPATATSHDRDPYGRGARARDDRYSYAARIASEQGYE